MSYNPIPPRVWSRVQNQCTYTDASGNSDINYNQVYIPLTKQTVTQAQANYEDGGEIPENFQKEFKVIQLINGYRTRGHLFTKTNPVRERRQYTPDLSIENFGLAEIDLESIFQAGETIGIGPDTLKNIISHLELTYCQSIGIEFIYMRDPERIEWFKTKIEISNRPEITKERKIQLFKKLNEASSFESFLGKKFVGQKRFSIEGGEALIPALDSACSTHNLAPVPSGSGLVSLSNKVMKLVLLIVA